MNELLDVIDERVPEAGGIVDERPQLAGQVTNGRLVRVAQAAEAGS